jgi:hypothetical protein
MRRIANVIKACVALPIYLLLDLARYARMQQTWPERIGVVIAMLPALIFVMVCWVMLWAFGLTGLRMLVRP